MAPKKKAAAKKGGKSKKAKEDSDATPAISDKMPKINTPKGSSPNLPSLTASASSPMKHAALEQHSVTIQQFARCTWAAKVVHRKKAEIKAMKRAAHRAWVENIKAERKKEDRRRKKEKEAQQKKAEEKKMKGKFLEAAFDDDAAFVKSCLAKGLSPEFQKEGENSPLSEAAVGGAMQCAELLLQHMADVNQRGQYGRTPIWRAAFGGHADMIRLLLKNGADPRMEAQGEAPIINASGEAKEALEKWDIAETEKLLVKYHQQREMLQKAESEKGKQQLKALESELAKAEKNDEAAQAVLKKARCSMEQRITEYDLVVRDGKNELQETALSYVKDAERDLAEAKEKADLAREALLAAKGALREEQEKPAQQRPGIDVDYEDIIEVLWKDVHKKVRNSGKWPFVVDPTLKTQTFLRYRDIVYINVLASREMEEERLRMHILGALRYGKPLVFDMMDVDMVKEMREKINQVHPECFEWLMTNSLVKDAHYKELIKPGDPEAYQGAWDPEIMEPYRVIFLTSYGDPNEEFTAATYAIWVTPDIDMDDDDDED